MIARVRSRLLRPNVARAAVGGRDHEGGAGVVEVDRRVGPAPLPLRQPRPREVAVLPRLGLVEDDLVAGVDQRLGEDVVAREGELGDEQARLELAPGVLHALVHAQRDAGVRVGGLVVVGVEGDHGEESLAGRLAARVLQLAEARPGSEGAGAGAGEVRRAVVGVAEGDVALGDAEPVADGVEPGPRLGEEIAAAPERADGAFDDGEPHEALGPPEEVAGLGASVEGPLEGGAGARVVAQEVVDLAEDDFGLRAAADVADALVALEGLDDERAKPCAGCASSLAMCPSKRSALASFATSPAWAKARRAPSASMRASSSLPM